MTSPNRWTQPEMMDLAARGMGRIDLYGPRGATLVSQDEVEAMAGALALLGLQAIHPTPTEYAEIAAPKPHLKGPADV